MNITHPFENFLENWSLGVQKIQIFFQIDFIRDLGKRPGGGQIFQKI